MTTVIFVHGTGIREREYYQTFEIIEQKIHAQRPDVKVAPCLWGELGAKFNAHGESIPLQDATLALFQKEEDADIILWRQLYSDPLYELRLLSLKPIESGNPFGEEPGDILQSRVATFTPVSQLQAKLQEAGITEVFEQAREIVIRSEPYERALLTVSESDLSEYYGAIARAIVAQAMFLSEQQQKFPPILTDAQLRDKVVELLTLALTEAELGLGRWLLKPLVELALPMGTNYIKGNRFELTDKISLMPGDILLYQARGEKIRAFIQQQIEQAEPPVVLIAHSLGGIACVDLLVQQQLSQVELLVTVGSQAPFLYEINALYSLEYGQLLPEHFPQWLNIYDLRDFLSYVGKKIFPDRVQDVVVDSRQPFPRSHGAYWTNAKTWEAIIPRLP
ncbi:alpha/beta hydrolase [Nostoc punctiforme FACHB-252]|uniref:Alpha/beta hydrolase n=1 Tax=Nostoc punctiforme FACHB-252 TaxID=1357509 RepID=A0ABR8HIV5_NOSPU|nr:alpha/beta hydrolase [Nostoc punctiforme]MBD2615087.1 alpha/beta hydrolase [Nostoc punctiforme FACHB-252]